MKSVAAFLVLSLFIYQPAAYAGSIPSKTGPMQSVADRDADIALARTAFGTDSIEIGLAAQGLTPEQISARLARLTTADVVALNQNRDQVKAAGVSMSRRAWIWTGVGAAVLVGGLAVYNDDEEDSDNSDDGED